MESVGKLFGSAIGLVTGAASHVVWYLRYQVEGVTRDQDDGSPKR